MSVNKSFYDKKIGATQTDPDLALRTQPLEIGKTIGMASINGTAITLSLSVPLTSEQGRSP